MSDSISKILNALRDFWGRLTRVQRVLLSVGVAGALLAIIITAILLNRVTYSPLYSELAAEESAEIVAWLDSAGVSNQIEGTTILVPEDQKARLLMSLASEGYPRSGVNAEFYRDTGASFMETAAEKHDRTVRNMQFRLQESLKYLTGVKNAVVNINLQQTESFVLAEDKLPATAAVILELDTDVTLTSDQIEAVRRLMLTSVPGLDERMLSLTDQNMRELKPETEPGMSLTRIELQRQIEVLYEDKVMNLLVPAYGPNHIKTSVNVYMNFDTQSSQERRFYPYEEGEDRGVMSSYDHNYERIYDGDLPGGVVGAEANTEEPPIYVQGEDEDATSLRNQQSVHYNVSEYQEQIEREGGRIEDITVAVLIDSYEGLTDEEMDAVRAQAAYAAGVDESNVAVNYLEFYESRLLRLAEPDEFTGLELTTFELIILAAGLLLFVILGVVIFFLLGRRRRRMVEEETESIADLDDLESLTSEELPGAIVLNETREQALRRQIAEFANANPDIVAQMIRTWVKAD